MEANPPQIKPTVKPFKISILFLRVSDIPFPPNSALISNEYPD